MIPLKRFDLLTHCLYHHFMKFLKNTFNLGRTILLLACCIPLYVSLFRLFPNYFQPSHVQIGLLVKVSFNLLFSIALLQFLFILLVLEKNNKKHFYYLTATLSLPAILDAYAAFWAWRQGSHLVPFPFIVMLLCSVGLPLIYPKKSTNPR